jgi:hypothetical protein
MMQTTNEIFQPVFLLPPEPSEWERIRRGVDSKTKEIEFGFNLSTKPHEIWRGLFNRMWGVVCGEETRPPMIGPRSVTIVSEPATLQSKVDLLKVTFDLTNKVSAPLLRGQAAQAAAHLRRAKALDDLMERDGVPMTAHSDGEVELNLRGRYVDRERTMRELHLAEVDTALSLYAESEIDEALSRL